MLEDLCGCAADIEALRIVPLCSLAAAKEAYDHPVSLLWRAFNPDGFPKGDESILGKGFGQAIGHLLLDRRVY